MSSIYLTKQKITDIADAIRTRRGYSGTYTLDQMPTEIGHIDDIPTEVTQQTAKAVDVKVGKKFYSKTGVLTDGTAQIDSVENIIETTVPSSITNIGVICYGAGKFVTLPKYSANCMYSTDGINWTANTIDQSVYWDDIVYGKGKFIAINSDGILGTSTDGINWTFTTSVFIGENIAYGSGMFVTTKSHTQSAYSYDGVTWNTASFVSSENWCDIAYGNGKFIVIANSSNKFAYSTDGINWTEGSLPRTGDWNNICYGDGKFVILSNIGSYFAYSFDGLTWTEGTHPYTGNYWRDICYGGGKFMAATISNTNLYYSMDAIHWFPVSIPSSMRFVSGLAYGNGKFIYLADSGCKAGYLLA